jgi:hypothetical protein
MHFYLFEVDIMRSDINDTIKLPVQHREIEISFGVDICVDQRRRSEAVTFSGSRASFGTTRYQVSIAPDESHCFYSAESRGG